MVLQNETTTMYFPKKLLMLIFLSRFVIYRKGVGGEREYGVCCTTTDTRPIRYYKNFYTLGLQTLTQCTLISSSCDLSVVKSLQDDVQQTRFSAYYLEGRKRLLEPRPTG